MRQHRADRACRDGPTSSGSGSDRDRRRNDTRSGSTGTSTGTGSTGYRTRGDSLQCLSLSHFLCPLSTLILLLFFGDKCHAHVVVDNVATLPITIIISISSSDICWDLLLWLLDRINFDRIKLIIVSCMVVVNIMSGVTASCIIMPMSSIRTHCMPVLPILAPAPAPAATATKAPIVVLVTISPIIIFILIVATAITIAITTAAIVIITIITTAIMTVITAVMSFVSSS